eukprot:352887-Chlamydomonas_euryale.AAC.7
MWCGAHYSIATDGHASTERPILAIPGGASIPRQPTSATGAVASRGKHASSEQLSKRAVAKSNQQLRPAVAASLLGGRCARTSLPSARGASPTAC